MVWMIPVHFSFVDDLDTAVHFSFVDNLDTAVHFLFLMVRIPPDHFSFLDGQDTANSFFVDTRTQYIFRRCKPRKLSQWRKDSERNLLRDVAQCWCHVVICVFFWIMLTDSSPLFSCSGRMRKILKPSSSSDKPINSRITISTLPYFTRFSVSSARAPAACWRRAGVLACDRAHARGACGRARALSI
jgi:hypothetical protein